EVSPEVFSSAPPTPDRTSRTPSSAFPNNSGLSSRLCSPSSRSHSRCTLSPLSSTSPSSPLPQILPRPHPSSSHDRLALSSAFCILSLHSPPLYLPPRSPPLPRISLTALVRSRLRCSSFSLLFSLPPLPRSPPLRPSPPLPLFAPSPPACSPATAH